MVARYCQLSLKKQTNYILNMPNCWMKIMIERKHEGDNYGKHKGLLREKGYTG